MIEEIETNVEDITDEKQVKAYLEKIIRKEAGDGTGLIYGMGHAVYTISDPRAVILKRKAGEFSKGTEFEKEFHLIEMIEKYTPELFRKVKGESKPLCANVDLYSGLVYKILGIPQDIFTPLFAAARIVGWSAHRMEEILTGNRIIRPAYKSVAIPKKYIPIDERIEGYNAQTAYIPTEERIFIQGEDVTNEN